MIRTLQSTELMDLYAGSAITGASQIRNVSTDTRTLQPGDAYVALRGPHFDGHDFNQAAHDNGASLLVVDHPDTLSVPQWIVPDTRIALGKLGAANRRLSNARVVALTGSSGKTTTKEILAVLLAECGSTLATRGNLNNDIGVPKTLLRIAPEHDYAVVELGANHLGEIRYTSRLAAPDVAVIVNAGTAHLAEFGSSERIREAKGEILEGLSSTGIAVLNRDDPAFDEWAAKAPGRVVSFSTEAPQTNARSADIHAEVIRAEAERSLVRLTGPDFEHVLTLPMAGTHNVSNLAAAVAVMEALNLPDHLWIHAVERIRAAPGRLTQHAVKGWRLIDDSYNANQESVKAAIDVLATSPGPQILVLGELAELGEHTESVHRQIGEYARQRVAGLWSVGAVAEPSSRAFGDGGQHFANRAEVISALSSLVARQQAGAILVKGSRSSGMETVMAALIERIEQGVNR